MNPSSLRLRLAVAAASLAALVPALPARAAQKDLPVVRLAATGELTVKDAGPYVHCGSYRIWVLSHLGRPTFTLPDGTLIYRDCFVEDSPAKGTLVVRFANGRVSQLRLVGHAVELALVARARQLAAAK